VSDDEQLLIRTIVRCFIISINNEISLNFVNNISGVHDSDMSFPHAVSTESPQINGGEGDPDK
jgi:hypothetical protein